MYSAFVEHCWIGKKENSINHHMGVGGGMLLLKMSVFLFISFYQGIFVLSINRYMGGV